MDGTHLRVLAQRLHRTADETRQVAARLSGAAQVEWQSLAADRYRQQLAAEAARVRGAAQGLDDAAGAMTAHARAVESRPADLLSAAAGAIAGVLG